LKDYSQGSKNREEIELQKGTPEQKNLRNGKYSANKMIRIKKMGPTREEATRISALNVQ
jgi:hypothetical protein